MNWGNISLEALKIPTEKPTSIYDSEEMERYTDEYVQFILEELAAVKQITKDPLLLIEQRLDFSNYVPEGFGTGDLCDCCRQWLVFIDFKYGQGVLVVKQKIIRKCYMH